MGREIVFIQRTIKTKSMMRFWIALFLTGLAMPLWSQTANFRQAERFLSSRTDGLVKTTAVIPNSIQGSSSFWYKYETGDGTRYYFVNPKRGIKKELFDRETIAGEIMKLTHEAVDYKDLNLKGLRFSEDESEVRFEVDTFRLVCDMRSGAVEVKGKRQAEAEERAAASKKKEKKKVEAEKPKETRKRSRKVGTYSPDGAYCVYVKDHDLYLFRESDSTSTRLSEDGEEDYSFAGKHARGEKGKEYAADVKWVDGSRYFVVTRTDKRGVAKLPVMDWYAERPKVKEMLYVMPGDKRMPQTEVYAGYPDSMTLKRVEGEKWAGQKLELYSSPDKSKMFFLRKRRTCDEVEFCRIEPDGSVKVLIHETCEPYFNDQLFSVRLSKRGDEIYWWSERTGYGHYYRYDGEGNLLNPITSGNWTAGNVVRIDTLEREFYFYAFGQKKDEPPYYQRLNKASLDGNGEVRMLTPEMGTHKATLLKGGYIVDNYSRADLAPRSVLRNPDGKLIMELETADLSHLFEMGWKFPEPIQVKAADGRTDLYGFMWKPFDFDSTRTYPVISYVYPGPQTEGIPLEFAASHLNMALAQVGFVVVTFGHRGGSPLRGKWYHTYGYGDLRDYPLADDKYGLEQLIDRYPFIDGSRVGIYGHSGGGFMSTAALCTYPDFYKAAVSSAGNHDNHIYNQWWGETHQGIKEKKTTAKKDSTGNGAREAEFEFDVETNMELAERLRGHLMLVFGDSDDNVHPAHTLRLADALLKAGKNFDMVVLPRQGHQYRGEASDFFQRKIWFHFAKHLLGDYSSEGFTEIDAYMRTE